MLTLAVSHAHAVQNSTFIEHLEQIEDGVIEVLQEHRIMEQRITQHMLSVCVLLISRLSFFELFSPHFLVLGCVIIQLAKFVDMHVDAGMQLSHRLEAGPEWQSQGEHAVLMDYSGLDSVEL